MVLGPVQGGVRDVVELLAVARVLGEHGQADADGDRLAVRELGGREPPVHAIEGAVGRPGRVPREQHRELLAADPVGAALAALLADDARDEPQHVVADRVAEAVVDVLERVEVDQPERHQLVLLRRVGEHAAQLELERAVVAEAGERVRLGGAHGHHGAVRRAQVEGEGEQGAGEQELERRVDLPQRHREGRDEGHDREGRAGVAQVAARRLAQRDPVHERDRDRDQGDVRDHVGGTAGEREHGQLGRVAGADRAAVPAEQERRQGRGERRQRIRARVERPAQREPALDALDDRSRDQGGDHGVLPAEQDLGGHQEHEGERDLAGALLVERYRLELGRERRERKHEHAHEGRPGGRRGDRFEHRPDRHRDGQRNHCDDVPEQSGRKSSGRRRGGG